MPSANTIPSAQDPRFTESSAPMNGSPNIQASHNMPANANLIRTDPRHSTQSNSVEDYSRIMLEYTQRRMAGFADPEDRGYATSRSSRSSNSSGQSGNSTSGILTGSAAGPGPTKLHRSSDVEATE